jgi:hypothetical protein
MLRPARGQVTWEHPDAFVLSDVDMLEFLLRARITHDDDVVTVQAAYEEHRSTHPDLPTFDELLDAGWFGVAWGRITTELHMRMAVHRQSESLREALAVVLDARRHDGMAFAFDDISALPEAARPLATRLIEHPQGIRSLSAPSLDWVVARDGRPSGLAA